MIINRKKVVVEEGKSQLPEHGVFFLDYDGTIVDAWASEDVASKTALPDNPVHTGLIGQGWNWSLADIKAHILGYSHATLYVGQMYETASGLTEIDIEVTKKTGLAITCKMAGNKNWGDGTTDAATSHTYANYGKYTITCDGTAITGYCFGNSESHVCIKVRIGKKVTELESYSLGYCYELQSVSIPETVTKINRDSFNLNQSLLALVIPSSVTSLPQELVNTCYCLRRLSLPNGITSVSQYAIDACSCLERVTIPRGVTYLPSGALYRSYTLRKIDCSEATSVITISNNTLNQVNSACKIIVPDALYDSWITASNWSNWANNIYKASDNV